jgi:GNAT superfamily N-acetyltransferase
MDAYLLTQEPGGELLDMARSVYAAAFAEAPYGEGPDQASAFVDRVRRYARERNGLRVVVVDHDGPAGMGLAVLARPGDWWRDRAAQAISKSDAERWLGSVCLEVVHLAVHPRVQGGGIGRLVHDILIAGTPAPTAILACNVAAAPARRLYAGRGWQVLTDSFPAGDGRAALLMGRRL